MDGLGGGAPACSGGFFRPIPIASDIHEAGGGQDCALARPARVRTQFWTANVANCRASLLLASQVHERFARKPGPRDSELDFIVRSFFEDERAVARRKG